MAGLVSSGLGLRNAALAGLRQVAGNETQRAMDEAECRAWVDQEGSKGMGQLAGRLTTVGLSLLAASPGTGASGGGENVAGSSGEPNAGFDPAKAVTPDNPNFAHTSGAGGGLMASEALGEKQAAPGVDLSRFGKNFDVVTSVFGNPFQFRSWESRE